MEKAGEAIRGPSHHAGDVVDDDGGGGAAIVHGGQAVVALLPRRVPDVELDGALVQGQGLREEGRPYG